MQNRFSSSLVVILLVAATSGARGDDRVDYLKQVKPVLAERCFACHGALKQEAGLRLDTAASALRGGDSGPAIVPRDPDGSLLLARVTAADESERMPPEGAPLKPEQIAAIRLWIGQDAAGPVDEQPERDPRDHWAFRTPVRPAVPSIDPPSPEQTTWPRNPIDAFLARQQRQRHLVPQPEADRRALLRRVYLDLIGLPPTRAELEDFVSDSSPDAYERVVARLLDSPHYGERWGRHWMDIWRYSDWWGLGAEVRNSQKHIWHWRDWMIESLNADQGYDQMLREMLAADELYPNDLDRLRATGYLARQYFIFNRTVWLDETIEHTAKGMLGLTFNCAKCHDHKYDPLSQVEYYQLRAIFEPYQIRMEMLPGQLDFEIDGIPRAFDAHLDVPTYLHVRGDDRNPDQSQSLGPRVPTFLTSAKGQLAIEPVALPTDATHPGLRDFVIRTHRQAAEQQLAEARVGVESAQKKLAEATAQRASEATASTADGDSSPGLDQLQLGVALAEKTRGAAELQLASIEARVAADRARLQLQSASGEQASEDASKELARVASRSERLLAVARADAEVIRAELAVLQASADMKAGDTALATAKTALDAAKAGLAAAQQAVDTTSEAYTTIPGAKKTQEDYQNRNAGKPFPTTSTGRRTAFAQWLTDPRHPLPARVAVNHIWMRHIGRPLVPTVFDFGRKGTPPTHPELLDWLAVELIEHDWSMKHLHQLIVTSQAYRLSSSAAQAASANLTTDPENHFYWRMNPVRMEAQIVRDSLLYLAGQLNLSLGGPSIPVQEETSRRRSLYFVHSHNDHEKFLSTFDDANVLDCYRRLESIVPQQALALENSPLASEVSSAILQRMTADRPTASDSEFLYLAFVTILSVEPTAAEQAAMSELLAQMTELARANNRPEPESVARTLLVQTLLNHNDFITIR